MPRHVTANPDPQTAVQDPEQAGIALADNLEGQINSQAEAGSAESYALRMAVIRRLEAYVPAGPPQGAAADQIRELVEEQMRQHPSLDKGALLAEVRQKMEAPKPATPVEETAPTE